MTTIERTEDEIRRAAAAMVEEIKEETAEQEAVRLIMLAAECGLAVDAPAVVFELQMLALAGCTMQEAAWMARLGTDNAN